jgi:hypothetical protein
MFSKRSLEGYFMRDHRAAGGALVETGIVTCSHCQTGVIVNPDRTRIRAYCRKCDHYICDGCEAIRIASGGECKTFKQIMDEHEKLVIQQEIQHG